MENLFRGCSINLDFFVVTLKFAVAPCRKWKLAGMKNEEFIRKTAVNF